MVPKIQDQYGKFDFSDKPNSYPSTRKVLSVSIATSSQLLLATTPSLSFHVPPLPQLHE
jgi:hypothetical protein